MAGIEQPLTKAAVVTGLIEGRKWVAGRRSPTRNG
jgi:hypothetical protein